MSWFPVLMKHIRYNVLEVHLNEKINLKVDSKFLHEFPVKNTAHIDYNRQ